MERQQQHHHDGECNKVLLLWYKKGIALGIWNELEDSIGNNNEISARFNIELLAAGMENGQHRG